MRGTILRAMSPGRSRRNFNLGNWLLGTGAAALGFSFWVPYASGSRTARTEERACDVAEILLHEAAAMQPLDLADPSQQATLLARTLRACVHGGVFAADLQYEQVPADAGAVLWLRNKHYLFQLGPTPADPKRPSLAGTIAPLEVLAWPGDESCPGHATFYAAEGSDSAFTRNLQADYVGREPPAWSNNRPVPSRRPQPAAGQRRDQGLELEYGAWRGLDDERWLLVRTPALPPASRELMPAQPRSRRR